MTPATKPGDDERPHRAAVGCRLRRLPISRGVQLGGLLFASALLACESSDSSPPAQSINGLQRWSLATVPVVSVKSSSPHGEAEKGLIATVRTSNGIAIAEMGEQQLQFYDASGQLLSHGQPAHDARDYLLWAGRCPGSERIVTQDFQSGSYTFLSESGDSLRTAAVPRRFALAHLLACPRDSSLVLFQALPRKFEEHGTTLSKAQLVRVDLTGRAEILREFAGTQYFRSLRDKSYVEQPLGRVAMASAVADDLFVGASDEPTIEVIGPNGEKRRRIGIRLPKRRATVGDLLTAVTLRIYREPSLPTRERLRKAILQAPITSTELIYDALVADHDGNVWLRTFELARADSARWRIIDKAGHPIAYSDLPADLVIGEIGPDYVVAIQRGPRDDERASVYRLVKNNPL